MQCVNSSDVSTTGHRGYGDFPLLAPIGQHTCIFVNMQNVKNTNKYDISSIVTPTRPVVESRKAISPSPISNQNTELDRLTPSQPKIRFHNRSEKTEHTIFHKKEIEYAAQKGIFFSFFIFHKRFFYFRYIYFLKFFLFISTLNLFVLRTFYFSSQCKKFLSSNY